MIFFMMVNSNLLQNNTLIVSKPNKLVKKIYTLKISNYVNQVFILILLSCTDI